MKRTQFWGFVLIIAIVGLGFEAMKNGSARVPQLAKLGQFGGLLDEGKPVYVPGEAFSKKSDDPAELSARNRQAPKAKRVAGLEQTKSEPNIENQGLELKPAATPAPKKDEKKDDKKKDDKKKKKKKTVKGTEVKNTDEQNASGDSDSGDNSDSNPASGSNSSPRAGGAAGFYFAAAPRDAIPQTLEEWESYVLREPNFERASLLIRLYQTGAVKRDIFNTVIDQMLSDSRPQMRELGVMALGATPSVRSFALLIDLKNQEKDNVKLLSQINTYLKAYTNLEHLQYLAGAIRLEGNVVANYEALRLLKFAARMHLSGRESADPAGDPKEQDISKSSQPVLRYFNPFLPLLQLVTEKATDSGVRNQANETLAQIRELLPPTTT